MLMFFVVCKRAYPKGHPKGPCTQIVYTLAPKYLHIFGCIDP